VSELAAAVAPEAATVLTPRELDVLKLVAQGLSNPEIAARLVLSEHTVHRHLANILRKLNLSSRSAAAAWGVRTGLLRRIVGRPTPDPPSGQNDTPAPDSLRELAYLDRINEIGPADQLDGATNLPRLYQQDYAILALLDRAGLTPVSLIRRAVLPNRAPRTVFDRMTKLYRHGLVAQHPTGLRQHSSSDGRPPSLYSLTRRGLEIAQNRQPPAISPKREWRPTEPSRALRLAHDLHALAWAIELHRLVGDLASDHWRTARYATGRYPVPQAGTGRDRHPITINEIPLPDKQTIIDLELNTFTEVKPDLSLELRIDTLKLTFDLLVELDLTARPSYNHDKLLAYDAFLSGWSLAHPRYRTQATRPALTFVCPDAHAALALAQEADAALTARIGVMGTPAEHWYHPARDHTFFAIETDIHHGNLSALALPPRPPGLRERLTGNRDLELERVVLLPNTLIKPTQR
jgi:DNA-binding CsgD family transcriptional regulator